MAAQFIVLEGGEGVGKSTAARMIQEMIPDSVVTREPGGTRFAERIREILLEEKSEGIRFPLETEFMLFWAARFDHIDKVINPALAAGKTVICDRFDFSTYAYQVYAQARSDQVFKDCFVSLRQLMLARLAVAPKYIVFDLNPRVGLMRVAMRGDKKTIFDEKDLQFHSLLREAFVGLTHTHPLDLWGKGHPMPQVAVVEAALPLEDVHKAVKQVITRW